MVIMRFHESCLLVKLIAIMTVSWFQVIDLTYCTFDGQAKSNKPLCTSSKLKLKSNAWGGLQTLSCQNKCCRNVLACNWVLTSKEVAVSLMQLPSYITPDIIIKDGFNGQ